MEVKSEVTNGAAPLPQRQPKNQQTPNKNIKQSNQQNDIADGAPAEKKPRFNQGGGGHQKGFHRGFGNRNRNRQNRGNHNQKNFQQNHQGNAKADEKKDNTNPQGAGQQNNAQAANQNRSGGQQGQNANNAGGTNANQNRGVGSGGGAQQQANQVQNRPVGGGAAAAPPQQQQPQQTQGNQGQNRAQQQQPQQQQQSNQVQNKSPAGGQQQQQPQQQQQSQPASQSQAGNQAQNRTGNAGQQQGGNQGQNRSGGNRSGNRERNRGRGGGGGGGGGGGVGNFSGRGDEFFIAQRLRAITGPTHELPTIDHTEETKFSGRNRLYVGNLTNDITEAELREMFKPFGEIAEIFSNAEKNFTFLKVDYHVNAEKAKRELDGMMRKGRALRVRFAPNATILRVSNLTQFVSNELLYKAFEIFGPVERASIIVDDRGKHTGEGVVEFTKKSSANACLRFCNEKCFFLTASLRPCVVEPFEVNDDPDGLPDKSLNKKSLEFNHERSVGPRFADLNSFEHEYGTRWKQLHELYKSKQEALKRELKMEEEKLEAQMEYARYEHETDLLRQELRKRESDNERKKMEWEMREKQAEDMRKRDEEVMRRQQNEMQSRMLRQEEDMRRRQRENTLFMQAQQLNNILDQHEMGFANNNNNFDNFGGGTNSSPFEFRGNNMVGGNNAGNMPQDSFPFEFGGNNQGGGNQRGNTGSNSNNSNINNSNNNSTNNSPWERRRRF